jgi:hypothetical protein
MGLKDIFTTHKQDLKENISIHKINPNDDSIAIISGASYTAKGTQHAGLCMGSPMALLPKLQATYMQLTRYIQQDKIKQNERKSEIRQEISLLEAKSTKTEIKIIAEQDKLTHEETKIVKIIKEIDDIKANPKIITGEYSARASFFIGFFIILLLTVYLFVFYSSASYSAFFKNFTSNDTNVAQAIFDAQALSKALKDGFTELVFILAIPAVFLGLGFLIHKFSEEKGVLKYMKISGLIVVTFVFDFIIAYEIIEKIYNIKKEGSFDVLPDMKVSMAVEEVSFWLIIFAGFVVYIIWGLVFDFTIKEWENLDKVRYAIKNKEKKLTEYKLECKQIKERLSHLQDEKSTTQGDIDKLKIRLETYVLYFNDVREGINNYYSGWVGYLKSTASSQDVIQECNQIKDKFLLDLENSQFVK